MVMVIPVVVTAAISPAKGYGDRQEQWRTVDACVAACIQEEYDSNQEDEQRTVIAHSLSLGTWSNDAQHVPMSVFAHGRARMTAAVNIAVAVA
jgi:hypothetical protein